MRQDIEGYIPQLHKSGDMYTLPYNMWHYMYSYGIPKVYLYDNPVQIEIDWPYNPIVIDVIYPETEMFDPHIEYRGEYAPDEQPEVLYITGVFDMEPYNG